MEKNLSFLIRIDIFLNQKTVIAKSIKNEINGKTIIGEKYDSFLFFDLFLHQFLLILFFAHYVQ